MRSTAIPILLLAIFIFSPVLAQEVAPVLTRTSAPNPAAVSFQSILGGLDRPLYVTHSGDDSGRLFVLTQSGEITVIDGETSSTFLDVSGLLTAGVFTGAYTERGLLGIAFHPDFAENGAFFINYTDVAGASIVARYTVSADDPNRADANSAEIILRQDQPFPNHNGGHMAFGPDGYLYISLGDGGAANDPLGAGQKLDLLLGKILRIDVNTDEGYLIPEDNPFVAIDTARNEIWSWGLRNVWRFSFDRATGDMYLGDVGQNQWEEINFEPADSPGGVNYGWNAYEATHVFSGQAPATDVVMPVAEYNHSQGCSVTGGYVYRGSAIPELEAAYLYGDYCSGRIWAMYRDEGMNWQSSLFLETGRQISSFGEDEAGELYIVDYSGSVLKMVPAGS